MKMEQPYSGFFHFLRHTYIGTCYFRYHWCLKKRSLGLRVIKSAISCMQVCGPKVGCTIHDLHYFRIFLHMMINDQSHFFGLGPKPILNVKMAITFRLISKPRRLQRLSREEGCFGQSQCHLYQESCETIQHLLAEERTTYPWCMVEFIFFQE